MSKQTSWFTLAGYIESVKQLRETLLIQVCPPFHFLSFWVFHYIGFFVASAAFAGELN